MLARGVFMLPVSRKGVGVVSNAQSRYSEDVEPQTPEIFLYTWPCLAR